MENFAVDPKFMMLPLLAQMLLTLVMFMLLGSRKAAAYRAGLIEPKVTALDGRAWPESVLKVSNNIANQFETPILFYVLGLLAIQLGLVSLPLLILSWLYVAARVGHAVVHVGSNYVPFRMRFFIVSLAILLIQLVMIAAGSL